MFNCKTEFFRSIVVLLFIIRCTVGYFTYWLNSKDKQSKYVTKPTKKPISVLPEMGFGKSILEISLKTF